MKLLIDTSLGHLFIVLINDKFVTIDSICFREKKKADILSQEVQSILNRNSIDIKNIDSIYTTLGPGSFMGARTAFIFSRTIAQVSNINLFTSSSFALFNKEAFIDAKSGKAYTSSLEVVDYDGPFIEPEYKDIIASPKQYLDKFKLQQSLMEIKPLYIKEPQIGGK